MATYKTEGFILRKKPIGEASRLYSIYTKEYGKIEAVAGSSSKITSKLAGDLEPFNFCQLMIADGRYFERIAGAKINQSFTNLKTDWDSLTLAWALAEGLEGLTLNHLAEPRIYQLLMETLFYLESRAYREEKIFIIIQFFWLVFLFLGHRPKIEYSQDEFQKFIEEEIFFNKKTGSFFQHNKERSKINSSLKIPQELFKTLLEIDDCYQSQQNFLYLSTFDKQLLKLFYSLVINYYQTLTNKRINSFQLLIYGLKKKIRRKN
jgi:DNA repair protein RecO